jgi:hypothetical protein
MPTFTETKFMKNEHCIVLLGVWVIVSVFGTSQALCQQEPIYDGKITSEWVSQLESREAGERVQARAALRKLGSNALPSLLREIRQLAIVYATNPAVFEVVPTNTFNLRALDLVQAFGCLGQNARPAAPELANLFEQGSLPSYVSLILPDADRILAGKTFAHALTNKSIEVRSAALAQMDAGLKPPDALVELAGLIYCLNDETPRTDQMPGKPMAVLMRARAARALGVVGMVEPERTMLALTERLQREKEPLVRTAIFYSFGRLGTNAKSALPALLQATNDPDHYVAEQAVKSLKAIEANSH